MFPPSKPSEGQKSPGGAEEACPAMNFWQQGVDCYNYIGTISNYLVIIIIAKNKNKLITKK